MKRFDLILPFAADVVCLVGVMFSGWNALSVILMYWLNAFVMIFFISVFLKKMNRVPWNISMIPGLAMIIGLMLAYYCGLIAVGEKMGYVYDPAEGFLAPLKPYFQIPIFMSLSALDQYGEYKYFSGLIDSGNTEAYKYGKLFVLRLLIIQVIFFAGLASGMDKVWMLLGLIMLKSLVDFWIRRR
ncbi:MAG TPA: hypothetical protein VI112_08495 [Bacteroidia bacterium]|jgi:hypothetical protein